MILFSTQDVSERDQYCQFYFVFYYLSTLPVSRSKLSHQARALSDYQQQYDMPAMLCFSLQLLWQTQSDIVFLNIYCAFVLCLLQLISLALFNQKWRLMQLRHEALLCVCFIVQTHWRVNCVQKKKEKTEKTASKIVCFCAGIQLRMNK